ncbi:menaquinone biosynthesis protein, partial [bacterium]|nr:menaquinone biosynthesis protein [bacterium]
ETPISSFLLNRPVVFGQIDFVNCLPITLPFLKNMPGNLKLAMDTPGELNRAYQRGELDLGAMSAHFYLEDGGFKLFDQLCIASRGAVGSVLFFSKRPLPELKGARIALSKSSATSNNLVKVLLAEEFGGADGIDFLSSIDFVSDIDAWPTDEAFDGCVIIGDRALQADQEVASSEAQQFERRDLGQWWFERYKLPMVFGVWAARKSWVEANPQDFATLNQFLHDSLVQGLSSDYSAVLAEAGQRTQMPREELNSYFTKELDYSFSPAHAEGLELFRQLCLKYLLLY